jgi:ribosomal protein L28
MAKRCDLCGRGATAGASRSHSKIKTLKRQNINLQSKTIDGVKLKVCTSCIRTIAKLEKVKAEKLTKSKAKNAARAKGAKK